MATHYLKRLSDKTACGKDIKKINSASDSWDDVTCTRCLKVYLNKLLTK